MTKQEKRILIFVILLLCVAVGVHYISNHTATAETEPARPSATPFRWDERGTEKKVWNILREELTETATAAIMGNMKHESGLCPFRYESMTYQESDNLNQLCRENRSKFIYSQYGFGLCCWYGTSNLERLWDFCEENGYDVDSAEGQARFLLQDLKETKPMCYERLQLYTLEQMMYAVEDFRQSYEKSEWSEYSQYKRGKYARQIYAGRCEDIYTISTVSQLPYDFDIYNILKQLNERIKNNEQPYYESQ